MGPERICAMHEDIFVEKWEARGSAIFFGSLVSMLLPVSGASPDVLAGSPLRARSWNH